MSSANEWPMVQLGEVVEINPKLPTRPADDDDITFVPMPAVEEAGFISSKELRSYGKVKKGYTPFLKDDLLLAKITPCFQNKKIAAADIDTAVGIGSTEFHVLRASDDIDIRYLLHFLRQDFVVSEGEKCMTGSGGQRRVPKWFLENLAVPLPPLVEQQRIAKILDSSQQQFGLLETKRADLAFLRTEVVNEVLDLDDRKTLPLKEITEIQSGITKGRKVRQGETLAETPYMAVSNVKDGYLDLQNVKTIPVMEAEITRFSLQFGDLLLTEGGDPDKLGRGTVWREEIETCLHQNHIFRVRLPEGSQFTPEVLMAMLATKQARAYFFRSAKQTTGIASINKTQLSAVPVPVLTAKEITKLSKVLNQIDAITQDLEKRWESTEELQSSLSARAFAGQL